MTRYEYVVQARSKRDKRLAAEMTCYGDNKNDAICHATQWWMHIDKCDYAAWCRITATRTGKSEKTA